MGFGGGNTSDRVIVISAIAQYVIITGRLTPAASRILQAPGRIIPQAHAIGRGHIIINGSEVKAVSIAIELRI